MAYVSKLRGMLVILAAVFFLAACATGPDHAHDDHDHGHDHEHDDHDHDDDHGAEHNDGRVLIGFDSGTAAVFDVHEAEIEAVFEMLVPAGGLAVYSNESGEFGYVFNRAESVVAVVDSGQRLEDHDGHTDLVFGDIDVLGFIQNGVLPTHFTTTVGRSGIYNDGSGDITVIDESVLRTDFDAAFSVVSAHEDHGAPVLLADRMLVGYIRQPHIEMLSYDGELLGTLPGISRAHGQDRVGRFTAFGAVEGVMIVTETGSDFEATMVANPEGTPEDERTGTVYGHPALPHFIGNLGAGLVAVNPESLSSTRHELPSEPWRFGIDRSGHYAVVLGRSGNVYVLDAETFDLEATIPAVEPHDADAPAGTPVPSLTLGRRVAFLSNPADNTVLEIDLEHGEVEHSYALDRTHGTVTSIAIMITDGVMH